jgi:hypothetical protein
VVLNLAPPPPYVTFASDRGLHQRHRELVLPASPPSPCRRPVRCWAKAGQNHRWRGLLSPRAGGVARVTKLSGGTTLNAGSRGVEAMTSYAPRECVAAAWGLCKDGAVWGEPWQWRAFRLGLVPGSHSQGEQRRCGSSWPSTAAGGFSSWISWCLGLASPDLRPSGPDLGMVGPGQN